MQDQTIPVGLCQCGCGATTRVSLFNDAWKGWVKGRPRDYLRGHNARRTLVEYVEEDRGYITPCWMWQLWIDGAGYGRKLAKGAHTAYYIRAKGPVPEGLELDHLCRVTACVNPDHLEPVTRAENIRRANLSRPRKTHCIRGHEFTPENTYVYRGSRKCRACMALHSREYAERTKAKEPK